MDITNDNFIDSLPEITETIAECDFIAIDTELSGLMRERSLNKFDKPDERFSKAVASSRGYFIMQFGLSCFKATGHLEYSNRTYNFYIFPQPNNVYGDINRTFSLQAHAIQFLTEHNFDFNKLFRQGVSYLTFQEKKLLMAQLKNDTKAMAKVEIASDQITKRKNDLVMAKGFLEVIELMIVHKKPIVGHNLSLDLIQLINQFVEPLSDDYYAFKETCNSLFPIIFDTKYIAHQILDPKTLTNNQSRLNDLYCQLKESATFPKISVDHLGLIDNDNQFPHQAGYDAYMSGYSFISLCEAYLRQTKGKKLKQSRAEDGEGVSSISSNSKIIDEFANRIHLSFSYGLKYFYLGGDDK